MEIKKKKLKQSEKWNHEKTLDKKNTQRILWIQRIQWKSIEKKFKNIL